MIALLIIVSAGTMLYGYLLACRLDRFMQRSSLIQRSQPRAEKEILLFGGGETLSALSRALEQAAIPYDITSEPDIPTGAAYHWIGAFSQDDADNLLICRLGKNKHSAMHSMAKCNHPVNETIFRQTGVTVIFKNGFSADQVLARLKG